MLFSTGPVGGLVGHILLYLQVSSFVLHTLKIGNLKSPHCYLCNQLTYPQPQEPLHCLPACTAWHRKIR